MDKIDIYIETKYRGNFAKGKGIYSIVLEKLDKNNYPQTKEHFGGYKDTTNNRLCILAVLKALECVKKPCEIEIHINNAYVAEVINAGMAYEWKEADWINDYGRKVKNIDLWEDYIKIADIHLIYVKSEKYNSYSRAMHLLIERKTINHIEDKRKEKQYV